MSRDEIKRALGGDVIFANHPVMSIPIAPKLTVEVADTAPQLDEWGCIVRPPFEMKTYAICDADVRLLGAVAKRISDKPTWLVWITAE